MPIQSHILESEPVDEDLAMILVGESKSGKSELASTAPDPVFFLDFDKRLGALKGKKGVFGLTFNDSEAPGQMPSAFNDMLGVLTKIEKSRRLGDIHPDFAAQSAIADLQIKTLVFDSIQTIANSAKRFVLYSNSDIAASFAIGARTYRVPRSYTAWGAEQEMVTGAILQARAIKGINVIAILHECMEQDERSTSDNPIYTGKIEVFPRRYNSLLVYFNEVWRVIRETGKTPRVVCDPDGKFLQAATALGIDKIDKPNIKSVLEAAKLKRGIQK